MQNVIIEAINAIKEKKGSVLLAIDGRCASGKTTLAKSLGEYFNASVVQMDDFFLRPEQRTPERLQTPGENVDHERFLSKVLLPLSEKKGATYKPFDCKLGCLSGEKHVPYSTVIIVEGSYSCHEKLWGYYDLHVFKTIDPKEQLERIALRNGSEALKAFQNKWIPLEEAYFKHFKIEERCEIVIK